MRGCHWGVEGGRGSPGHRLFRLQKRSDVTGGNGDDHNLIEHSLYMSVRLLSNQPLDTPPTLQIEPAVSSARDRNGSHNQHCKNHVFPACKLREDEARVQPVSEGLGAFC